MRFTAANGATDFHVMNKNILGLSAMDNASEQSSCFMGVQVLSG